MNVWHMQIYYNSKVIIALIQDSVRDLGLLCRSKMLRPVGIMVVNGTRSVFLMSVVTAQSLLNQFRLVSA